MSQSFSQSVSRGRVSQSVVYSLVHLYSGSGPVTCTTLVYVCVCIFVYVSVCLYLCEVVRDLRTTREWLSTYNSDSYMGGSAVQSVVPGRSGMSDSLIQ